MADPVQFDIPVSAPDVSITTSQINKELEFTSSTNEFIPESKIVFHDETRIIKTLVIGSGLEVSNGNLTLKAKINGYDFVKYVDTIVLAECSFFAIGDRDIIFNLLVRAAKV